MMRTSRLLRSRNSTPSSSIPDSPRSLDSRINVRARPSMSTNSPLNRSTMIRGSGTSSAGYESDDSLKFERSNHLAMAQDVMSIKTMLLKLKRILHEVRDFVSYKLCFMCVFMCFSFSFSFLHVVIVSPYHLQTDEEVLLRVSTYILCLMQLFIVVFYER